jgi:hypothetical protein
MQYTSKLAILAVAFFSTSALAAPYASFDGESELEVREADNDLSAREFFDAYLEAREDPSLDARDLEALDLEAREYLEYLEMRAAATSAGDHSTPNSPSHPGSTPQTPMSATHSDEQHPHFALLKQDRDSASKAAAKKFKNLSFFNKALANKDSRYHRYAVATYLHDPANLKKALADTHSLYHKDAKRVEHRQKAKTYFAKSKNYKKALKFKHNKFHKDAVRKYLSDPDAFENALTHKRAHFHKEAVHKYLLDSRVRKAAIADKNNRFHKAAGKLQKKLDSRKKHGHKDANPTSTHSVPSATATPTHAA